MVQLTFPVEFPYSCKKTFMCSTEYAICEHERSMISIFLTELEGS